ncbi:MAG: hypothetical protein KDH09_14775 [Chrysiogenetes bacterium]|nr:hypothetical protein [Chrysiogenetes bacterium]
MSLRDNLVRGTGPRVLIRAWHQQETLAKGAARAQRLIGGRASIEFFFAFDSPYSAVSLAPLLEIAGRHRGELQAFAVGRHGIQGDPDARMRKAYEILDAGRLLRRQGKSLTRTKPLPTSEVRELTLLAEAARRAGKGNAFAAAALDKLWCEDADKAPQLADYEALYSEVVGKSPGNAPGKLASAIVDNEKRLERKGHWEVPTALVGGQWFFAHERIEQIDAWLGELGW